MISLALAASIAALLETAKPGRTVVLPAGDYGPEVISGVNFSPPVTLDARSARLTAINFKDVSGLHVVGGTWSPKSAETRKGTVWGAAVDCQHCRDVSFDKGSFVGPGSSVGADVTKEAAGYGASFGYSEHVAVTNSTFVGFRAGLLFGLTSDVLATHNDFSEMSSDGIDLGQVWRAEISHINCHDFQPAPGAHPDCIQAWSRPYLPNTCTPAPPTSDLVITDNVATIPGQGIFAGNHVRADACKNGEKTDDGGFDRMRIERNRVTMSGGNAIGAGAVRGLIMRNNHVSTLPGSPHIANIRDSDSTYAEPRCGNVIEPGAGKAGLSEGGCRGK